MRSKASHDTPKAIKPLNTISAYVTLSSVVYYATAIFLLHVLRTDFDPEYRYLSEYAVGPYGALMTSTFFVLSLGSIALPFGLLSSVSSRYRFFPGLLFWLAWAGAVFLAGFYPSDLQGAPHTRVGQIHDRMGMIAFPSAAVAIPLLSLPLRWEKEWHLVWGRTMFLSLVVVVCFLALDSFGRVGLEGLDQRIFLAATLMWMWILGRNLLMIAKRAARLPPDSHIN